MLKICDCVGYKNTFGNWFKWFCFHLVPVIVGTCTCISIGQQLERTGELMFGSDVKATIATV